MTSRLPSVGYLAFPLRIGPSGAEEAERVAHVRQQIEQTLFTAPGERVFRAEFGAGVKRMVFEPNSAALAAAVESNLRASLQVALQGEVDPTTLQIAARRDEDAPERLLIEIAYALSAIGRQERHVFRVEAGS
jgi:hypothetical protein